MTDSAHRLDLLDRMIRIREFEEGVRFLFLEGAMPGTIHQCQGQEATAVGVCAALRPDDFITSTFRGHGHAIAKGLSEQELLDELFGASTGCCKGKGGSMHVGNMSKGMVPGIAIVGGGIPLAAGMALAFKMQKTDQVVACFFGDGAVAEGAFHEGVNMAAIWSLPAIFVCENNLYGASTRIDLVMQNPRVADRAASYGIRRRDGRRQRRPSGVRGGGARGGADAAPATGRFCSSFSPTASTGHSRRDPCHYQPEAEREAWAARDPIERFAVRLQAEGIRDEAGRRAHARASSAAFRRGGREGPRRAAAHPRRSDTDVFAVEGRVMKRQGIAEALRDAIAEEMERDPRVFCIGEDIGVPGGWGGAFTVTLGLEKKFPDRIINTPIAELGFFGVADGAAMMGMRPIVDVQYGDFLFLASDQIINNAAKMRYMSGGQSRCRW